MDAAGNIYEINLSERMKSYGATGMLLSLNVEYIHDNDIKEFCIRGGIVICLCNEYIGHMSIDGRRYELEHGCLAILPENNIIRFSESMRPGDASIIAVSTDYILDMPSPIDTDIFNYSRYIPVISVSESKYEDFQSYFRFLDKESRESSRYQNEIIKSILYALILEISGEYELQYDLHKNGIICSDNLIDKFFHLLAVYLREERTVKFYADKLCVTSKYLTTAVKKATGRPVLDWIHEAILIEAKMLLRTTGMTITEIADRLNFSCSSAFIQFFKKHTGTTPKDYLKYTAR